MIEDLGSNKRSQGWCGGVILLLVSMSGHALGAENRFDAANGRATMDAVPEVDPHAHHRHMLQEQGYNRSLHEYRLPDLAVVDMSGSQVSLSAELDIEQPVILNFIFTTCTTICPVLSASLAQVQRDLGPESEHLRMVSITIDPEYDTPARLRAYAERFDAGPQWQFLTGNLQDIVTIQKAFDAYRGTKANHVPLTFLKGSGSTAWVRLEGSASAADIVAEYHSLELK